MTYEDFRSNGQATPSREGEITRFIDRPVTPRAMSPFRDRATTPGAVAQFREKAMTPAAVAPFSDRPITPDFISDGKPLGSDHRSPAATQVAASSSSSSWEHRGRHIDQRSWSSRSNKSPPYRVPRSPAATSQRPFLEPSQAWKRTREERDRQLRYL